MGLLVGCGSNTEKATEQPSVQYEPTTTKSTTTAVDPSADVESSVASTPDKPPYEPTSSNIWFAAAKGSIDDVRHYLNSDSGLLNRPDEKGFAPLHKAALAGQMDTVTLLLDSGAEINVKQSTFQGTPLQYAAARGHLDVVKLLVDRNANLNAKDTRRRTPLDWADTNGHAQIVQILRPLTKVGEAPTATKQPAPKTKPLVAIPKSKQTGTPPASLTPYKPTSGNIWLAAAQGKTDDVRHFLKANRALLNQLDENGFAPLHRACSTGQLEVVEVLLDSAVEINVRQATHQGTPLQYAVDNGHTHVVTMLLDAGAEVDAADDLGRTPLIWATMKSRTDIVRLLLNHEANIYAMMKGGRTALQFAQQKDNDEIAQLLTTAASVQSGTLDKRLAVALNKRQADIVAELLKRGAKLPPASAKLESVFHRAAAGGDLRMVQVLIPHITDIDHPDHLGRTALMFAANAGHTHVVAELARLGADVNLKTSGNWTALHVAVKAGQQETAQRLIDLGADFQVKNSQGKTPLALNPKMTFNLTRSKDVSASPGNASSAKNTASPLKDEPKRQGTLVMNDKTYRLQNAMAYTIVKQSRKLMTVVLSEKPAIQNVPDERRKGREPGAFVFGPRVKLRFDESGKLTYLNVVADNHSINIDRPNFVKTVFAVKNGKVRGTASMQNPQKPNFASASYRFDVTFDVEILRGEED
ncbi:MAG: ankyrin repeat domain-containing protein [Pirellulaceae bacterium]|nr:ankyrin repeat domain-containing protein [Pirellulaceae bacterium]